MASSDICWKSKGCSRPMDHYGPCNNVLIYECLCDEPSPEVLKGWRSDRGAAIQCRKCGRCIDPRPAPVVAEATE